MLCRRFNTFLNYTLQITLSDGAERSTTAATFNKGKCYLKLLQQRSVLLYVHFLGDVMAALKKLTETFQRKEAGIIEIHRSLSGALVMLEKYKTR